MGAVAGTFVKIEPVATRKVVRLHIECPIEQADDILRQLGGYPDPAHAHWVGIAPLTGEPTRNTLKGGKLAQKAGILCGEPSFCKFIQETYWPHAKSPDDSVDFIRQTCDVESRAHLDHDEEAARRFRDLETEYRNWLGGRTP